MVTKLENGTIQNITWSTGGKMFVSEAYGELPNATLDSLKEGLEWNLLGNPETPTISPVWDFSGFNQNSSTGKPHH
jgi:hypothetical protein